MKTAGTVWTLPNVLVETGSARAMALSLSEKKMLHFYSK
jgi:hypothetical protein